MDAEFEDKEIHHLLRRHVDLENQHDDGDAGNFPSGWQCENPWRREIEEQIAKCRSELDPGMYTYVDDNEPLRESLSNFHVSADGVSPSDVFIGDGSSSVILTFAAWLCSNGYREGVLHSPSIFLISLCPSPVRDKN